MKLLIFTINLFLAVVLSTSGYAETLTLSITTESKDTQLVRSSKKILSEIGIRIGVSFKLEVLPCKRADRYLNNGTTDGDIGRILEFGKSYPHLVRVKEPMASFPYYVYTTQKNIKIESWADLKPFDVVYVSGTTYIEANLKQIHKKLHPIGSLKQAIKFIAAKRADLFISSPYEMLEFIKNGELKRLGIKVSNKPISILSLYTYFHPRHKKLAKRYNFALKQLKKDGTYLRIVREVN